MKVEFSDEILKGEIIIDRPLTVFTGRNGTGKTYAAEIIQIKGERAGLLPTLHNRLCEMVRRKYLSESIAAIACEMELALFALEITPGDYRAIYKKEGVALPYVDSVPDSLRRFTDIAFKLKYGTKNDGLFILDLPETHQDPHNQVLIARFIVRLANAGLKVVLVTHSNYIIREINNLIMLSGVKDKARAEFTEIMDKCGISAECGISAAAVRAYNFEGGEVRETGVTRDGFEVKFIDDVIDRITDETADFNYLLYDENEG